MMDGLIRKAKGLGIDVFFLEIEKAGYYVPDLNAIFINQDLREGDQKEVLLHELKHAVEDKVFLDLYEQPVYHSKMEADADLYVLNSLIEESGGYYNISEVVDEYNLTLGWEEKLRRIY